MRSAPPASAKRPPIRSEPSYIFKEDVAGQVMQDLATVLAQVNAVQQYGRRRAGAVRAG